MGIYMEWPGPAQGSMQIMCQVRGVMCYRQFIYGRARACPGQYANKVSGEGSHVLQAAVEGRARYGVGVCVCVCV